MEIIDEIIVKLRKQSDMAYMDYLNQLKKYECLGWEAKVECGKFGQAEFDAHTRASSDYGRHLAFNEVIRMLHQYRN